MAAFELLNDRAILVRNLPSGFRLAPLEALRPRLPGLVDAVQAFGNAAFYFEDELPAGDAIVKAMLEPSSDIEEPRRHELPICFELGEDLAASAEKLGVTSDQLAEEFVGGTYLVEAIGFSPGFPYLSGLPAKLCGLPRLQSPRPKVEPGSIGLAEGNACVYPSATPGGWNLIARTPYKIVDLSTARFPIAVGDILSFKAVSMAEFRSLEGVLL